METNGWALLGICTSCVGGLEWEQGWLGSGATKEAWEKRERQNEAKAPSQLRLASEALERGHQRISLWLGEKRERAVFWGLNLNPGGRTSV